MPTAARLCHYPPRLQSAASWLPDQGWRGHCHTPRSFIFHHSGLYWLLTTCSCFPSSREQGNERDQRRSGGSFRSGTTFLLPYSTGHREGWCNVGGDAVCGPQETGPFILQGCRDQLQQTWWLKTPGKCSLSAGETGGTIPPPGGCLGAPALL